MLLMRAMSLGLIKGTVDQVEQKVSVSWLQPRVLEVSQMKNIKDRLDEWSQTAHHVMLAVEDGTAELFA